MTTGVADIYVWLLLKTGAQCSAHALPPCLCLLLSEGAELQPAFISFLTCHRYPCRQGVSVMLSLSPYTRKQTRDLLLASPLCCQALADGLSKGRHYVFPDERGSTALDPRLLLVEFNSSILLHQSQVRRLRAWLNGGCLRWRRRIVVDACTYIHTGSLLSSLCAEINVLLQCFLLVRLQQPVSISSFFVVAKLVIYAAPDPTLTPDLARKPDRDRVRKGHLRGCAAYRSQLV